MRDHTFVVGNGDAGGGQPVLEHDTYAACWGDRFVRARSIDVERVPPVGDGHCRDVASELPTTTTLGGGLRAGRRLERAQVAVDFLSAHVDWTEWRTAEDDPSGARAVRVLDDLKMRPVGERKIGGTRGRPWAVRRRQPVDGTAASSRSDRGSSSSWDEGAA